MIDGIFFINLDNRPDRLEHITSQIKKIDIVPQEQVYRVEAVLNKRCGHLGCSESHIKALQLAKEKGCKYPLILEDDFWFDCTKEELLSTLAQLPPDWDVFMAAIAHNGLKEKEGLIRQVEWATTTSGYIVRDHFVDALLANFIEGKDLLKKWVDEEVEKDPACRLVNCPNALDQHWFPLQAKHLFFTTQPTIGHQGGLRSSILARED